MMDLRNLLIVFAIMGGSLAAKADETSPQQVQNSFELAQRFCPAEIDFVSKYNKGLAERLATHKHSRDPVFPQDQYLAFHKVVLGHELLTELVLDMAFYTDQIEDKEPVPEKLKGSVTALLQLTECLSPTSQDRILVEQFLVTAIDTGELEVPETSTAHEVISLVKGKLYSQFESMECRKITEFHRRVLSVDPASPDVADQVRIITKDTIGRCEEAG